MGLPTIMDRPRTTAWAPAVSTPRLEEKPLAAQGRAGDKSIRIAEGHLGDVDRVEPVDVLARVNCLDNGALVDVRRRRGLHEDAVNRGVRVEPGHEGE